MPDCRITAWKPVECECWLQVLTKGLVSRGPNHTTDEQLPGCQTVPHQDGDFARARLHLLVHALVRNGEEVSDAGQQVHQQCSLVFGFRHSQLDTGIVMT